MSSASAKYYTISVNGAYVDYCVDVGKGWSAPVLYDAEINDTNWKKKAVTMSRVASWLCVLDCTLLPIMTTLFPLLGVATSSLPNQEWVHDLGHSLALYFVLPVGVINAIVAFPTDALFYSSSTVNKDKKYSSSTNINTEFLLFAMTALGLSFVYAANGEHDMPLISSLPHHIAHDLHCGTLLHKTVNLLGCALMLTSNYISHQYHKNKQDKHLSYNKNNRNTQASSSQRQRMWRHVHTSSCSHYSLRILKKKDKSA